MQTRILFPSLAAKRMSQANECLRHNNVINKSAPADSGAVGGEGHVQNAAGVAKELCHLLARRVLPEAQLVLAEPEARQDLFVVWVPKQRADLNGGT